ncbi:MAG: ABC transporter permease subunit [Wujia sp.]
MTNLIRANLKSLPRYKTAIFSLILEIAFTGILAYIEFEMLADDGEIMAETSATYVMMFMGIIIGVIACSVAGTDYHEGTMRNKLIAGYSRTQVYISNYITTAIYSLLNFTLVMLFNSFLVFVIFEPTMSTKKYVMNLVMCIIPILVSVSIYNMIAMLLNNKTKAIIACIVMSYVFLLIMTTVEKMQLMPSSYTLRELPENLRQEMWNEIFSADSEEIPDEYLDVVLKNSEAKKEPFRTIYVLLDDIIPESSYFHVQLFELDTEYHYCIINIENVPHQIVHLGLAAIFGVLLNVIGVQIFKKKRLR